MKPFTWEVLSKSNFEKIRRAKVPGGWVILHESWDEDCGACESMVFVADAPHKWEVEKEL
jgi:hypothetical protein